MAMSFRQIGKGLVRNLGKGAGKVANVADAVSSGTGRAVAGVANTMDDIAEGVPGAFSEGLEAARKPRKPGYQETRQKSSRVQREIAEGKRDADGRKIKEARNSGGANEAAAEAVNKDIKTVKGDKSEDFYFNYDGTTYRHTTSLNDKKEVVHNYARQHEDGSYTTISGKRFGGIKKAATKEGTSFYASEEDLLNATKIAETETAETAGFNLGEFIDNHPVMSAGALVGGGFLLSELLDDD